MSSHPREDQASSDLLSLERKAEIEQEEIYRQEVRKTLGKREATTRNRLSTFLNSSLGIWFLSTIVVSGLGTIYTLARDHSDRDRAVAAESRQHAQERRDQISRLDLEISFRLSNLLNYTSDKYDEQLAAIAKGDKPEPITEKRISLILQVPPSEAVQYNYPSLALYQEYRGTTLISLLAQLRQLELQEATLVENRQEVPPAGETRDQALSRLIPERVAIDRVIAPSSAVSMLFRGKVLTEPANGKLLGQQIYKQLLLYRWRDTAFPYTDCSDIQPFC